MVEEHVEEDRTSGEEEKAEVMEMEHDVGDARNIEWRGLR